MKVIDLLNKIANGEEAPKKIMVNGIYFKYDGELTYTNKDFFNKETYLFSDDYDWGRWINDEVEILEEENNKIEKLPYYSLEKIQKAKNKDDWYEERITLLEKQVKDYHNKINELIDVINESSGKDKKD